MKSLDQAEKTAEGSEFAHGQTITYGISEKDALRVGDKVYRVTSLIERIK